MQLKCLIKSSVPSQTAVDPSTSIVVYPMGVVYKSQTKSLKAWVPVHGMGNRLHSNTRQKIKRISVIKRKSRLFHMLCLVSSTQLWFIKASRLQLGIHKLKLTTMEIFTTLYVYAEYSTQMQCWEDHKLVYYIDTLTQ